MVGKDDKEYIIEVNDCATTLFGESQEDDRKYIAELTLKSMEVCTLNARHLPTCITFSNQCFQQK